MDNSLIVARSAWEGIATQGLMGKAGASVGLEVRLLDHGFAASVMAGADDPLGKTYAMGQRHRRGDCLILPLAPGNLFVEGPVRPTADTLSEWFGEEATIVDQTGSRASLRLSGPPVYDVLAKGVMIDCDPRAFPAGSGCATMLGFLSVQISVYEDGVFELSAMRSMAGDLWHWLVTTASPYGLRVTR